MIIVNVNVYYISQTPVIFIHLIIAMFVLMFGQNRLPSQWLNLSLSCNLNHKREISHLKKAEQDGLKEQIKA